MSDAPVEPLPPAPPDLQRYKLTLAYDGTLFHGWQKQEPPDKEPLRTVAGVLERTLVRVMQQPISVVGSSRTDAGVHALGQVAHFDAVTRIPIERLAKAINSRLPDDIDVLAAEPVSRGFDAISSTKSKQYRYRLYHSERRPLNLRNCVYHCWTPLELAKMNDAAQRLVGTHDFVGFTTLHHDRKTTVRTIFDCHIEERPPEVHIVVTASGFLYNMVRIIAGTLLEVGRGRFAPDDVDAILKEGRDPKKPAGPTLPPQGLWLEWIRYEE